MKFRHSIHLGGGFKYFCYFHPYLGKWSNLTNIFQMGWNHQPVIHFLFKVQVFDREFLTIHPLQMDHFSTPTSHLHVWCVKKSSNLGKIPPATFFFRLFPGLPWRTPQVFMMTRGTRGDVQPFVALARGLASELGWLVPELHGPELVKSLLLMRWWVKLPGSLTGNAPGRLGRNPKGSRKESSFPVIFQGRDFLNRGVREEVSLNCPWFFQWSQKHTVGNSANVSFLGWWVHVTLWNGQNWPPTIGGWKGHLLFTWYIYIYMISWIFQGVLNGW